MDDVLAAALLGDKEMKRNLGFTDELIKEIEQCQKNLTLLNESTLNELKNKVAQQLTTNNLIKEKKVEKVQQEVQSTEQQSQVARKIEQGLSNHHLPFNNQVKQSVDFVKSQPRFRSMTQVFKSSVASPPHNKARDKSQL